MGLQVVCRWLQKKSRFVCLLRAGKLNFFLYFITQPGAHLLEHPSTSSPFQCPKSMDRWMDRMPSKLGPGVVADDDVRGSNCLKLPRGRRAVQQGGRGSAAFSLKSISHGSISIVSCDDDGDGGGGFRRLIARSSSSSLETGAAAASSVRPSRPVRKSARLID